MGEDSRIITDLSVASSLTVLDHPCYPGYPKSRQFSQIPPVFPNPVRLGGGGTDLDFSVLFFSEVAGVTPEYSELRRSFSEGYPVIKINI